MLTSTSTHFSSIKIDYKLIELLRKAVQSKTIRVTPDLLAKLDEVEAVEKVIDSVPSTSSLETSNVRRSIKRKVEDESKPNSQVEKKCTRCGCRMLRVVDPRRQDHRLVLECMRTTCLASVEFTDLPLGTIVGKEINAASKSSNYSLARYYPMNRYTPTPVKQEFDSEDQEQRGKRENVGKVVDISVRGVFIDVPGQETKARFAT